MPELPEVETVRRAIATAALGHEIAHAESSGQKMRWPIPKDIGRRISGHKIINLRRRGKYIIIDLGAEQNPQQNPLSIIIHLGMSGSVRIYPRGDAPAPVKHDHLTITTSSGADGGVVIVLNDPRRFGGVQIVVMGEDCHHSLLKDMGVEPLGNEMNGVMMHKAFCNRSAPIKNVLLDQRIIAGIGNIYASEALFEAKISPRRGAKRISAKKCETLAMAVRDVLMRAIAAGGTSLQDHVQPDGKIGYFAQQLNVYGQEDAPCPICQTPIKMIRQGGRASFYCPACQR